MPRSTEGPVEGDFSDVTGEAQRIPTPALPSDAARRLRRLRALAWWLDGAIPVGGRWRIGLDPIIGLIPGIGDWIGATLSLYIVYEGARLGLPIGVLVRMGLNVLIETVFGAVPIFGDLFDFAWQANLRNVRLVERHYDRELKPRSFRAIGWAFALFALAVLALVGAMVFLVVKAAIAIGQAIIG